MVTAEKHRCKQAVASVRPHIEAHIAWLQAALDWLNAELHQALRSCPLWRESEEVLRSVPSVGPILALTHEQGTALVGVAPLNHDSGFAHGKRLI
jgi:transposase